MERGARPAVSEVVRPHRKANRESHRGQAAEGGGISPVDGVAFAIFVGCLVLAFTTEIPDQFALPKLLALFVYAAFASVRWIQATRRGLVAGLPRGLALVTAASACWWVGATLTARHLTTAVFGMRGRYNGVATLLAGLAVFVFIATTRLSDRGVERRLVAICAALTIACGYAFVQAAGLDPIPWPPGRPASTLGHPVVFAGTLALILPFGLAFALLARSRAGRLAWTVAMLAQGLALTLSLARGPWIGAFAGVVVFAALTIAHARRFAPRLAGLLVGLLLVVSAVLVISAPTRSRVVGRLSTLTALSEDPSLLYRAHFFRAALGMLRDHPLVGVGWENFGLLYPAYRSSPTPSIAADLTPTMVHSGPLQTAVSAGIPALALQLLFFAAVGLAVTKRWRAEPLECERLLGAAFLASAVAWFVQDLSGWPHVALGSVAFLVWGLAVSWSLGVQARASTGRRWLRVSLAAAVGIGCAGLALSTWRQFRAERLIFEAEHLDLGRDWNSVEEKLRAALELSRDRAWASDAAARLFLERAALAGDRRAYERGIALSNASRAANPFDPYLRLRRTEFDMIAMDHGLITRLTEEGRDALAAAESMTSGSNLVRKVEASLLRKAGNTRIVWIQPAETAGFGPAGSLIVGGSAPSGPPGARVFLHWRNVTRKSAWVTEAHAPVPESNGDWFNAIRNASLGDRYEAYASFETWSYGPCTYMGNGAIKLCAPLAFIGPDTSGVGPPGSLIVAGSVPEAWAHSEALLHRRNATRRSEWTLQPIRPGTAGGGVSFPADAPGNWYTILPDAGTDDRYEVYLSTSTKSYDPCLYPGDGTRKLCAPIAWIQPQASAGFGPPGSLVVAGFAPDPWAKAPVHLHWRNATRGGGWATEAFAATPDDKGVWYSAIPNANLYEQYQIRITSPTSASITCTYTGNRAFNACP